MNKRISSIFIMATVIILAMIWNTPARANGQETCPHTGGWVKVDGLSGLSYTYNPPAGYHVTDNCYKAGTSIVFGSGATVNSTVWNKNGCPDARGCNYQELSHASFLIVADATATPVPTQVPTPTNTTIPEPTPTDVPPTATPVFTETPIFTPTVNNDPTPVPTDRPCPYEEIGELFLLIGPNGERGWLGSYQRNPNTGLWAIPNTGSQLRCLGFIAVNAEEGRLIYRDCNGNVNYLTYRCDGGAPCYAYR